MKLKPCPCGVTPKRLNVSEGSTFRWRAIDGGCCGYWEIEGRINTMKKHDPDVEYEECVEIWNEAPRVAKESKK